MDWLGFGELSAAGGGLEIEDVSDHGGSSGCACQTYVLVQVAGLGALGVTGVTVTRVFGASRAG